MYQPLPNCTCSAAAEIEKTREAEKMHQFVMRLDESRFSTTCQTIISSDLDMGIGEIYAKVVREEQHLNSAKDRESQQTAVGFVAKTETDQTSLRPSSGRRVPQCTHCGRRGHEKSGCWQVVGFPEEVKEETEGDFTVIAAVVRPALIVPETQVLEQTLHTQQHQTRLHSRVFNRTMEGIVSDDQ